MPVRRAVVVREEAEQDEEGEQEVDHRHDRRLERDHQPRHVHLRDEVDVRDHAARAPRQAAREVDPDQVAAEDEDRVRHLVLTLQAGDVAEDDGEQDHRQERHDERPERAEDRLDVAHLDVAPDEEAEQLAVVPDLAQLDEEAALAGPDAERPDDRRLRLHLGNGRHRAPAYRGRETRRSQSRCASTSWSQ